MGRGEVMVVSRTSRYVIELSADERDELERRAREVTAPGRDVQRARMILYAAEGMADIEIAARLDCHPDSVSIRRRRFCAERLDGLQDKPRAGRPRRFPPEQVAEVIAVACEPQRVAALRRSSLEIVDGERPS